MPRSSSSFRSTSQPERANLYDEITDRIVAELEAGRLPWVQPWGSSGVVAPLAMPKNAATGRSYSGINVLILWGAVVARGYSCQSWLTFRQALGLGGNVREGERGTTVVYADRFVPDDEKRRSRETGEEAQTIPFLKRYTVFSVDQCDGLPDNLVSAPPPVPEGLIAPELEALIQASGADMRLGGSRAFYSPALDQVQVPRPEAYFEPINWHRTALHELGHWTGHGSRLGRDMTGSFGSKKYAQEELVAEMTAAFCCATLGIVPTVRHADYIGSWLEVLREDNRAVVRAASAASKAADYLLAFRPDGIPDLSMRPPKGGRRLNARLGCTTPTSTASGRRPWILSLPPHLSQGAANPLGCTVGGVVNGWPIPVTSFAFGDEAALVPCSRTTVWPLRAGIRAEAAMARVWNKHGSEGPTYAF